VSDLSGLSVVLSVLSMHLLHVAICIHTITWLNMCCGCIKGVLAAESIVPVSTPSVSDKKYAVCNTLCLRERGCVPFTAVMATSTSVASSDL